MSKSHNNANRKKHSYNNYYIRSNIIDVEPMAESQEVTSNQVQYDVDSYVDKYLKRDRRSDNNQASKYYPSREQHYLHEAVQQSNSSRVGELLEQAAIENDNYYTLKHLLFFRDKSGQTALHKAASLNKISIVISLLDYAKKVSNDCVENLLLARSSVSRETALHVAAKVESFGIVERLLNHAETIKRDDMVKDLLLSRSSLGENVLHEIARNGNNEIFTKILSTVNTTNNNATLTEFILSRSRSGATALYLAVEREKLELVKKLLNIAKDIKDSNATLKALLLSYDNLGKTVLHKASAIGNVQIIEEILSIISDNINDGDATLKALLLSSSTSGEGATYCPINLSRENALHEAVKIQKLELVKKLLNIAKGINDNNATLKALLLSYNNLGETALHKAVQNNNNEIIIRLLSTAKDVQDNNDTLKKLLLYNDNTGETALYKLNGAEAYKTATMLFDSAKLINKYVLVELLLSRSNSGETILHHAVKCGNTDLIKTLTRFTKNVEDNNVTLKKLLLSYSNSGKTALYKAVKKSDTSILELLLDTAKSINIDTLKKQLLFCSNIGENALYVAIHSGNASIVTKLLDISMETSKDIVQKLLLYHGKLGATPLHAAAMPFVDSRLAEEIKNLTASGFTEQYSNVTTSLDDVLDTTIIKEHKKGRITKMISKLLDAARDAGDSNATLKELLLSNNDFEHNPLHAATHADNADAVKKILEIAQNIIDNNFTIRKLLFSYSKFGRVPLHIAAEKGNAEIIKSLLKVTKDLGNLMNTINMRDVNGNDAIQLMINNGHSTKMKEAFAILQTGYPKEWARIEQAVSHNVSKREVNHKLESVDSEDNHNNQEDVEQKTIDDGKSANWFNWIPNIFPRAEAATVGNNNRVAYQSEYEVLKQMDYSSMVDSTIAANLHVNTPDGKSSYSDTSIKQVGNLSVPLCNPSSLAQAVNDNISVLGYIFPYLVSKIFGTSKPSNSNYITPSQEVEMQLGKIASKVSRVIPLKDNNPECTKDVLKDNAPECSEDIFTDIRHIFDEVDDHEYPEDVLIDALHLGDCNG